MKGWALFLVISGLLFGCAGSKSTSGSVLPAPKGTSEKAAVLMNEGDRRFQAKDWAGAAQAYEAATGQQTDLAEAHYNLAVCLDRMGHKSEAKKHYITAANLAPGHKVIWDSPPMRETGLNYNIDRKSFLDPNPRGGF